MMKTLLTTIVLLSSIISQGLAQEFGYANKIFTFASTPNSSGDKALGEIHFFSEGQYALLRCLGQSNGKVANPIIQRGGWQVSKEGVLTLQFDSLQGGVAGIAEWISDKKSSSSQFTITNWRQWNKHESNGGKMGDSMTFKLISKPKLTQAFINYANEPYRDSNLKKSLNLDHVHQNDIKKYPWKWQNP